MVLDLSLYNIPQNMKIKKKYQSLIITYLQDSLQDILCFLHTGHLSLFQFLFTMLLFDIGPLLCCTPTKKQKFLLLFMQFPLPSNFNSNDLSLGNIPKFPNKILYFSFFIVADLQFFVWLFISPILTHGLLSSWRVVGTA